MLVDGRLARRRQTGVATYVRELRAAIGARPDTDLRVEVTLGPPGLPRRNGATSLGNLALDLLWLHVCVPLVAWRSGAALVHAPMNWAPLWCPCPVVVTVQDLSFERLPDRFPPGFRRYARLFTRLSARRARLVLTASHATARDVEALYGVPAARIRVVPLGVRQPPVPAGANGRREDLVLSVGVLDPRKRIAALVEGHRRYLAGAPDAPPPCRLVVVGGGGGEEEEVRRAAGPGCEIAGFVSEEELAALYRRAALLVYPSAYEGFGLPVLEAMAHGCPVLVARNSALPEVGGDVALYLDDASPDGIARALADALADRPALAARGEAGRAHSARFSWDAAAAGTLAAFREAISLGDQEIFPRRSGDFPRRSEDRLSPARRLALHSLRLGWRLLRRGGGARRAHLRAGLYRMLVPLEPWRVWELGRVADEPFAGSVLDVGSPKLLPSLLAREGRGDWVAVDLLEAEIAAWRALDPELDLRVADARALPFEAGSFDACACVSVIEHVPGEGDAAAMAEMWRVLRPGGVLHLVTNVAARPRTVTTRAPAYGAASPEVPGGDGAFFERHYSPATVRERLLALPWEILARECVRERLPVHRAFFAARPLSFALGVALPLACARNFAPVADLARLGPREHAVLYLRLRRPRDAVA